MRQLLITSWPLFLGIAFLMLGNGLQGTLVSWRGTHEGFSATALGIIATGYYIGFLMGSRMIKEVIENVGYIRVFAALASLASTAILIQVLYINAPLWFFMRVVTGFCFAGLYVVSESWLNQLATNDTRGSLFSIYMVVSFIGLAAGQWLLQVADPSGVKLFIIASILLSLSLIPMLISRKQSPDTEQTDSMSIAKLYSIVPAGVVGMFCVAIGHSVIFGMGAVYATKIGLSIQQIAMFMSLVIATGAVFQWPLGWLSDSRDRRIVLVFAAIMSALFCILILRQSVGSLGFYALYGAFGAMALPMYSITVAHSNDRLKPDQMVAASSVLVLVYGLGSIVGPMTMGFILDLLGNQGYFIYLAGVNGLTALIMIYFISQRDRVKDEHQVQYQPVSVRPTEQAMEVVAQQAEAEQLED
ncbi:MAG: MFS transporter [Arenicellales bacterium]